MATISRTSASLLVGLALVCVVAAGWWWTTRPDDGAAASCPLRVEPLAPRAELVDRGSLLPSGTVGERRRTVVEGISGLGPLGEVTAGRFYERQLEVPALVAYGDRLALVTAPEGEPATVTALDPAADPAEATDWSARVSPVEVTWTSLTGGAVGDDWVSVFSGPRPVLLTLDEDGGQRACLSLPMDGAGVDVTAVTDQAGEDVVVLASAVGSGWWLGVVDPVSGDVGASRRVEGPGSWESVEVTGGLVVGSRWRPSTVGTSGAPRPADAQAPWITAWGLDGEDRWTYPAAAEEPFPAVLLDQADDGTSYVVSFDRGGPWLDALSAEGDRVWRTPLRDGEWSGELWDDVVVVRGPAPSGGPMLRAFDAGDGSARWAVTGQDAPPVGESPRAGFGSPLSGDDAWWLPAPNGLLRIDRGTDEVERVDSAAPVDEMVRVGDHVVVRSGTGVLVTRPGE